MKQQVLEETFEKILKKEPNLLHVEIDEESPYLFLYPYFLARKRNTDLQKIDHQNCCVEMDHAEFKRKICNFQNRGKLLFFLLNTLLLLKIVVIDFVTAIFNLDESLLNLNFLIKAHTNLYHHINQLFYLIKILFVLFYE